MNLLLTTCGIWCGGLGVLIIKYLGRIIVWDWELEPQLSMRAPGLYYYTLTTLFLVRSRSMDKCCRSVK